MVKKSSTTSELGEIELLRKRIAELESLPVNKSDNEDSNYQEIKISSDEAIPILSLFFGKLNLSTEGLGKGHKYWWSEFGQRKTVPYADLAQIINAEERLLERGYFYIMDERVIKKHGLTQIYENILDKKKLEQVFNLKDGSVELYQSANDTQKNMIETFLIQKMAKDESVDLNVIGRISKIAGYDLFTKAQEIKERNAK